MTEIFNQKFRIAELLEIFNRLKDLYFDEFDNDGAIEVIEFYNNIGLSNKDITRLSADEIKKYISRTLGLYADILFNQYDDVYEWKAVFLNETKLSKTTLNKEFNFYFLI